MSKLKLLTLLMILAVAGGSIVSFKKADYYNKNHYSFYKNPSTFGNGSNGIAVTFKNWKVIPRDNRSDLILWKTIFKNTSNVERKLFVTSYFKDDSFMNLADQHSPDNGKIIRPGDYKTFNGKKIIPKNLSKLIKRMNIAISSTFPEIKSGKRIWRSDKI